MNKNDIKALINKSNPVIFEIGCADGKDTEEFVSTFNDTQFQMFCFEPDPRNCIEFNKRINDPRVKFFQMALGDVDSDSVPFYQSNGIYSSSLRQPTQEIFKIWPVLKFETELTVVCRTLDTIVKENNISFIDYIWADVQGAEDLLINGGKETFKSKVKYFYTEFFDIEIYKGEKDSKFISSMLPGYCGVINETKSDILFRNESNKC